MPCMSTLVVFALLCFALFWECSFLKFCHSTVRKVNGIRVEIPHTDISSNCALAKIPSTVLQSSHHQLPDTRLNKSRGESTSQLLNYFVFNFPRWGPQWANFRVPFLNSWNISSVSIIKWLPFWTTKIREACNASVSIWNIYFFQREIVTFHQKKTNKKSIKAFNSPNTQESK